MMTSQFKLYRTEAQGIAATGRSWRKKTPRRLLACVTFVLLGSFTAQAQFHPTGGLVTCFANSTPTIVRAEGIAEILGDIVAQCVVSTNAGLPSQILTDFSLTLNTNVTNNRDFNPPDGNSAPLVVVGRSNVTDAVLLVNENTGLPGGPVVPFGCNPVTTPGCFPGQSPQYGILRGNNTLAWNGVAVTPTGVGVGFANTVTTIRFTNIRGNASIFAGGDLSFPSAQLTGVLSVTGTTNLTVTSNVLNVGSPLTGLSLLTNFRAGGVSNGAEVFPGAVIPTSLIEPWRRPVLDCGSPSLDDCGPSGPGLVGLYASTSGHVFR